MPQDLSLCLNEHAILKKLAERFASKEFSKTLRLFTFNNDIIYIWSEVDKCVYSIDVKRLSSKSEENNFVRYELAPVLYFQVECLSVNVTASYISFHGPNGIAVSKLPDRWLVKDENLVLTTDCLAHKVFVCDHHVVRCVSWHPGSLCDSHLLLLTSDEVLRLYNVVDCSLIWETRLTDRYIRRNLPNKISLGETPVCFDFGVSEILNDNVIFPVYTIWGNGDVFKVDTSLAFHSIFPLDEVKGKIEGPLRYEPFAIDNYGVDASSVIVLDCYPPIIALATCKGLIHHCLLMNEDSEKVLHVFETLELKLGIVQDLEKDEDVVSCPVRLEKDPNMPSRYFCLHSAGIHSVTVPLVEKLSRPIEDFIYNLDKMKSSLEYLLCTSLTGESSNAPVLGVLYYDMMKIYVLQSTGKFIKVPLYVNNIFSDDSFDSDKVVESKVDDYKTIIDVLLKENGVSSFPLVKLSGDVKPQELFKIVTVATSRLRSVLKCHSDVVLKIHQKVESFKSVLDKQREEMDKLNGDRPSLRSAAEQIAEKYEEINEKQNELVGRVGRLLLKIDCDRDHVSTANEKKMSELLGKAKEKLKQIETDIVAVQSFHARLEVTDTKQTEEKDLHSDKKLQMVAKSLKNINKEVGDLKKRMSDAIETVQQCRF